MNSGEKPNRHLFQLIEGGKDTSVKTPKENIVYLQRKRKPRSPSSIAFDQEFPTRIVTTNKPPELTD